MAVTPRRLSLTRDQFASFLQDFEQIKQFENLFATVDTISSVTLDEINIEAGNANANANEANDSIQRLLDSLDRGPTSSITRTDCSTARTDNGASADATTKAESHTSLRFFL
jgi:hypothetical protein